MFTGCEHHHIMSKSILMRSLAIKFSAHNINCDIHVLTYYRYEISFTSVLHEWCIWMTSASVPLCCLMKHGVGTKVLRLHLLALKMLIGAEELLRASQASTDCGNGRKSPTWLNWSLPGCVALWDVMWHCVPLHWTSHQPAILRGLLLCLSRNPGLKHTRCSPDAIDFCGVLGIQCIVLQKRSCWLLSVSGSILFSDLLFLLC